MKRYVINYKGKKYTSKGEDAVNAFSRFAERKVFGRRSWIENSKLDQFDADTCGKKWAQFWCGWDLDIKCLVELIK